MKNCPNCGTEISTNFCYNCGWDGEPIQDSNSQNVGMNNTKCYDDGFLGNNRLSAKNGTSATIMAKDWFAYFGVYWLITIIPFIGPVAGLVYTIVMLCRKETAPSIRGLIKFQLILSAIMIALFIILIIVLTLFLSRSVSLYGAPFPTS